MPEDTQNRHDEFDPDSFYPFRVQIASGQAVEIPEYTPEEGQHHPHHHERTKQQFPPILRNILIGFGVLIFLLSCFIWVYNWNARQRMTASITPTQIPSPTLTPIPSATPTPTQIQPRFPDALLQEAYTNTTSVSTAKVAFASTVETTINQPTNQTQQKLRSNVSGYLVGSAIDDTMQTELRIAYADDESRNAEFRQILVGDNLYLQTNTSGRMWDRRRRSDYNRLYENQPLDATTYAYNMLDTLFSSGKALFRAIDVSTVQPQPEREIDGKTYAPYVFRLTVQDYIQALERDPDTTEYILEDARKILANASISGTIFVNKDTRFIERLEYTGTNFTQISNEDSQNLLGITTTHNMSVVAIFSEFNAPLTIIPPPEQEVR
jgi:hypothetical protein